MAKGRVSTGWDDSAKCKKETGKIGRTVRETLLLAIKRTCTSYVCVPASSLC
jgi:hypothetical protein